MRGLIFDLDGTLVDTVYGHVFAWQRALAEADMAIDGWKIHRRIGTSGGLFTRAVARELGRPLSEEEVGPDDCYVVGDAVWDLLAARRARMLSVGLMSGGYGEDELTRAGAFRVYRDADELRRALDELGLVP